MPVPEGSSITAVSAITLAVTDMQRSVTFYQSLGFALKFGGDNSDFSSFFAGTGFLNLTLTPSQNIRWWGRAIFYVDDVDNQYQRALAAGLQPDFAPRDAPWGERYFHIRDPDGHEISFARPL